MHVNHAAGGIIVDTPLGLPGATVRSPFLVTGEGDLFDHCSGCGATPLVITSRSVGRAVGRFRNGGHAGRTARSDRVDRRRWQRIAPQVECGEPNPAIVPLTLTD